MIKNDILKKILRQYDEEKLISDKKYQQRISEIYQLIPEIKDVDDEIMKVNINFARAVLKKINDTQSLSELKEKNKILEDKRKKLFQKFNIGEKFFLDIYKCPICKDTGYVGSNKCECFKKRIIEEAYDMSNIKENLKYENFERFDISFYSAEPIAEGEKSPREKIEYILLKALNFVKDFDNQFNNLFLYGKSGLGKTFLCNCIAKGILDKGKSVLYLSAAQLFKMLENYTFKKDRENEEDNEIFEFVFDSDLLIIDDLGTEFYTAFTASEFFNIINLRFLKKKPIVISTNLSPQDIRDKYSDRVVSRFYGNYDFLEFLGEDIRILKLTR